VNTADVWAGLTMEERATLLGLAMPSMRRAPLLLRLRYQKRAAGLANREIAGENAGRLAFARYLRETHRLSDE